MVYKVESFTIDSTIKGNHVYKDFCWVLNTVLKEVENGLMGKSPTAAKPKEIYSLQSTCKETKANVPVHTSTLAQFGPIWHDKIHNVNAPYIELNWTKLTHLSQLS